MHITRLNRTALLAAALFALHGDVGTRTIPSHARSLEAAMSRHPTEEPRFGAPGADEVHTPRPGADDVQTTRLRAVEIRTYTLVPGTGAEFHRLVIEGSLPLLEHFDVDVVAYGPSLHDPDSYVLIRAFDSVAAREAAEETFYSSEAWRSGPRDEILARIESYSTAVVELDETAVDQLRTLRLLTS